MKRWLIAALVLLLGRGRRQRRAEARARILPAHRAARNAENLVLGLLAGVVAASACFVAAYVWAPSTQLLGLTLGLAIACLGAAAVVASRALVPQETRVEPLGERREREAEAETAQLVEEAASGITRRKLLFAAAGGAVGALGAAAIVPAASLGPVFEEQRLLRTPWRSGRRLVDHRGRPIDLEELGIGAFVTAFPEGAPRRPLDSPLVVVRLDPAELDLPTERAGWAAEGALAFSKICTHAGCAVSLFRYPLYDPTAPGPALVCPCHFSAFDPTTGGDVIYGPAARALPQLPLGVDESGALVARGDFSAPPGPSWLKVRRA